MVEQNEDNYRPTEHGGKTKRGEPNRKVKGNLWNCEAGDIAQSGGLCLRAADRYAYWLWKHCLLLSFYLMDEQMLIDI